MLVKYIRDFNNDPIGVVVATGPGKVGVSICNPKDRFDKELGVRIAAGRAESSATPKVPHRIVDLDVMNGLDYIDMNETLEREVNHMLDRSNRYFKTTSVSKTTGVAKGN